MEIGLVRKIDIDEEMQQAYLDYAMSVIVARALPDARDGLKPVHRRILYAMHDMGLASNSPHKKSARIVGEVLGKYHPHGDMAVYDAMARMAQSFSMRALLVDGQGNFGSVDGDPPAAMRYTEARLTALAENILADINKNTVDFLDNFDGTLTEPEVTPAAFPNLLVNGATGIAVGMMTSIPPHNLGEVIDGLGYMLENWEKLDDISIEDLLRFIQGPDFPTGGVIIQDQDGDSLASAYATGRGRVIVQAQAHLEEMVRGRNRIIVTELPYMTNKSSLIERIADLVRGEKLEGIADLRDESDRQGMRIVIELNKAAEPEAVLRDLYKNTQMRATFSLIMLALVGGEPRLLSLKQALRVYLEHRLTIVRRRSEFELARARQRAHILEGLRVALKNLDEVITLIRKAPDAETARERLMKRFRLSDAQAQAILDMPLRRLAALERKKIEDEYRELLATIKNLEGLLRSAKKMRQVVGEELSEIKKAFADPRRTRIVHLGEGESRASLLTTTDLVPDHSVWVMLSPSGLLSRTAGEQQPKLSGQELASSLLRANTHDTLCLVGESGEAAAIPLHVLPQAARPEEGAPSHKLSPLKAEERVAAIFSLPAREARAEGHYLLTVTRQGMVKKTALAELPGPTAQTFTLVKVNPSDRLGWAHLTDGGAELLLATAEGMAIRFKEEEVRPMGLVAAGVMGIKLQAGDEIAATELFPKRGEIFMVASDGSAKRVEAQQFPQQGRYGQGVIAWKLPKGVRVVGMAAGKAADRVTLLLEKAAPKTIRLDEAPLQGRSAGGKPVLAAKSGLRVTGLVAPRLTESVRPRLTESVRPREVPRMLVQDLSAGRQDGALELPKAGKKTMARAAKAAPSEAKKTRPATGTTAKKAKSSSGDGAKTSAKKPAAAKKTATAKAAATKAKPASRKAAEAKQPVKVKSPAKRTSVKAKAPAKSQAGKAAKPATAKKAAVKLPAATKQPAATKPKAGKTLAKGKASKASQAGKEAKKPTGQKTTSVAKKTAAKTVPDAKDTPVKKSGKSQKKTDKTGAMTKKPAPKKSGPAAKSAPQKKKSSSKGSK